MKFIQFEFDPQIPWIWFSNLLFKADFLIALRSLGNGSQSTISCEPCAAGTWPGCPAHVKLWDLVSRCSRTIWNDVIHKIHIIMLYHWDLLRMIDIIFCTLQRTRLAWRIWNKQATSRAKSSAGLLHYEWSRGWTAGSTEIKQYQVFNDCKISAPVEHRHLRQICWWNEG